MTDLDRLLAKLVGVEPDWKWHPTSDIAQAMMCAEKHGYLWLKQLDDNKWESDFYPWDQDAQADTPALAICRAIEKALEAK